MPFPCSSSHVVSFTKDNGYSSTYRDYEIPKHRIEIPKQTILPWGTTIMGMVQLELVTWLHVDLMEWPWLSGTQSGIHFMIFACMIMATRSYESLFAQFESFYKHIIVEQWDTAITFKIYLKLNLNKYTVWCVMEAHLREGILYVHVACTCNCR